MASHGVSRDSIDGVRNVLTQHGKISTVGLSVSEISRELDFLSRGTIYKCLDALDAVRDDAFYPPTYRMPTDGNQQRDISIKLAIHLLATGESDERETTDRILALI